jgi:iron complex outermembrane recepter protein
MRRLAWALFLVAAGRTGVLAQDALVISGTVTTRADGLAVAGAVVSLVGSELSVTTDAAGRYSLPAPPAAARTGPLQLRVDALGLPPKIVDVATTGPSAIVDIPLTLAFSQEVTVGSRASDAASGHAVPVDVISRAQISASGFTELAQLLESVVPSFNFPRPTIADGTDTVRPATLRGLGPDQVLVLVNGKRRHQSALVHLNNSIGRGSTGVDLNAIPITAIDHIEVLRDGAAAQYGSDAIAGVINIVLSGGVAPASITANFGASAGSFAANQCTPDGRSCIDGQTIDFSDGGLADVGGSWGIAVGRGSITIASEYRHHNQTNRASPDPRDQIVPGDAGRNAVAQPNHRWGDPDTRDAMTFVNANIPLGADTTQFLYVFGGYSRRLANSAGFFRRALDARTWPDIYPNGFLPTIEPTVEDASAAAGIHGVRGGWLYDLGGQYGRNRFAFAIGNSLNVSLGPASTKTQFDAGALVFSQLAGNVDISRGLPIKGLTGPLNLAFGAEVRRESYGITAGEPDSYRDGGEPNQFGGPGAIGAQVFPGFRPSNEVQVSRSNVAAYIDLEGNVRRWLRFGAAGRTERYSDFGSTVDGKLTVRVQPFQQLAIRGSASTGFRAPSLSQSYFSSTATNFLNLGAGLVPVESLTLPVSSAAALVLGATALKPERSLNLAGGIVVTPMTALEIAADYYRIAIDDRIVLSGNFTAAPIAELLAPFGANSARFFTNAIDTRSEGVDVSSSYRATVRGSDIQLRGAYNHSITEIIGAVATPPQLAAFSSVLFDRIERRRLECGQPHDGLRLGGSWSSKRFAVDVNESRYGEFCSFTLNPSDDQVYGAEWLTDLELSIHAHHYRFAVGALNIFDALPDRNSAVNSFNGIQTFPSQSPFGMNGRTVYARIRWEP